MKRNSLFLFSFTSIAVMSSPLVYAEQDEQFVSVPVFEGGLSASIGTFLVTPSSDFETFTTQFTGGGASPTINAINVTPDYQWGIDASLGWVFEDTANAIQVLYRNITTSDTASAFFSDVFDFDDCGDIPGHCNLEQDGNLGYELESGDIIISQFINIGENMQMQFFGGLAYVDLEYDLQNNGIVTAGDSFVVGELLETQSRFSGWGPRIGIDSRYDFGDDIAGFGIVGGGSVAFFFGELDINQTDANLDENGDIIPGTVDTLDNNLDNHTVTNLRANLGIDYVYFFDNDESTLGLELGYMVDYYDDAAGIWDDDTLPAQTSAISFSGPYLNLKGVF